jgi:hypothetical protein
MALGIPKKMYERFSEKFDKQLGSKQFKSSKEDYDYKSISAIVNDCGTKKAIEYFTLTKKGKTEKGVNIRSGKDFIYGEKNKGKQSVYRVSAVPAKYKSVVDDLKTIYNETIWSKAPNVNMEM